MQMHNSSTPIFSTEPRFGDDLIDPSEPRIGETLRFLGAVSIVFSIIAIIYLFDTSFAGVVYGLFFCVTAWLRFDLALALTLAAVPFQQDLGGLPIKLSLAEINLALLTPISILRSGRLPFASKLIIPPILYLLFCIAISTSNFDSATTKALIQMAIYLILAVSVFAGAGVSTRDYLRCFDVLAVVATLLCVLGIATNFTFLGVHKNGWGASLSLVLIIAFEMWQTASSGVRKNWYGMSVGVLSLGLVLTVSRGGWIAAVVGIGVLLSLRRDWKMLGRLVAVVLPLICVGWYLLPEDIQEYAIGFESRRVNIQSRWRSMALALSHWQQSPWFGTGVGLRKQYDATNIVLFTLAETGVIGLLLFVTIHVNIGYFVWRNHLAMDSRSMSFSCLALGGALVAARFAHGMVDHYWSRGAILAAWAAAGMAIAATEQDDSC